VPDEHVGEIWLHGENIGIGYWGRTQETAETFRNTIADRLTVGSHAEGTPADAHWLRTGDYGVYVDGELYITGRVKDLVIVDGRNHYPQDLEFSAQEASSALRPGFVAAFAVPANQLPQVVFENSHSGLQFDPDDASEQLVIVAERASPCGISTLMSLLQPASGRSRARRVMSSARPLRMKSVMVPAALEATASSQCRGGARAQLLARKRWGSRTRIPKTARAMKMARRAQP